MDWFNQIDEEVLVCRDLVALRTGMDMQKFLLGDHLGSTAITTNSSGVKSVEVRYYPWGTDRYTSGTTLA